MSSRNLIASVMAVATFVLLAQTTLSQDIPMNDLALWLDASNPASLSADAGGDVTTWLDLSGNDFNAVAGDAAPTVGVWPNNGAKTVNFSGGGQVLETPDYAMPGSLPYHIFVVEEYLEAGSDGTWLSSANPSSGCCGSLLRPLSGDQPGMRVFSGPTGFPDDAYDATSGLHPEGSGFIEAINRAVFLGPGLFSAFSAHREGENMVRNQLPFGPNFSGTSDISQMQRVEFPEHALTIGRAALNGGTSLTGSIAEVIVYERELSAAESTQVQNYLFDKWLGPLPDFNEWGQTGVGAWSDRGNWSTGTQGPGPPNDDTRVALFGDRIMSPQTVSVNTDVTVKDVRFDSANSYAVAGPGSVTLQADAGNATVHAIEGAHELQVRVNLGSDTDITADSGTQIDFYNGLTLGGNDLNILGDGQVNIHNIVNSGGGAINNSGNLAAGGSSTISGDLVSTGTISIDLAGTGSGEFDSFHVGGVATLSGLIDVQLSDGFTPSAGDTFNVLSAGSILDNGLALTPAAAGLFKLSVGSSSVILSAAIPEPTSLLLVCIALVGIAVRRQLTRNLPTTIMAVSTVLLLATHNAVAQMPIPTGDLALWLDAATLTGNEGEPVEIWSDLSGNGFDAVMASFEGAEAPTVGAWPNGGLKTVTFTGGTLQGLVTDVEGFEYAMPTDKPSHIFIVEEYINTGNPVTDGSWYSTANPGSGCCGDLLRPLSTPEGGMRLFTGDAGWPDGAYDAVTGMHPEGPGIIETITRAVFGTPGEFLAFSTHREGAVMERNRVPFDNSITQASRAEVPLHELFIGKPGTYGQTLNGSIAEFIVYERELSTSESEQVQNYLFDKWFPPLTPDSEWRQDGVGAWSNGSNWLPSSHGTDAPDGNNRSASFGDRITSPQTVSVNTDVTVKDIQFESANTYAIGGPGSVTLESDSGNAAVGVTEGTHEFQVRVNLASPTDITATAGTQLDLNNQLTLNDNDLNISGEGKVNLNIVNSGNGTINNLGILGGSGVSTISGDLMSSGTLSFNLGGIGLNEFDSFDIGGTATLLGLLDVELINGFTPSSGDMFNVLTAGGITDNGLALTTEAAAMFALDVGSTSIILSFTTGSEPLAGDYDGSDEVEVGDLNLVLFNWDQPGSTLPTGEGGWVNQRPGDTEKVGVEQLNGVLFNWGNTAVTASAPEPTSLLLLVMAWCGVLMFRRR